MQEVFEKIITNLENEVLKSSGNMTRTYAFEKAIEIVKQTAEEYNNGWISCSGGKLPEEYEDVEVTVEEMANDVGGKRYYNIRSWLQDGQWVIKKNPYHPTVIAWKYPTEPYQPNICTAGDCPINDGNECPASEGCAGYQPNGE